MNYFTLNFSEKFKIFDKLWRFFWKWQLLYSGESCVNDANFYKNLEMFYLLKIILLLPVYLKYLEGKSTLNKSHITMAQS